MCAPSASMRSATCRIRVGDPVERSAYTDPGCSPSERPCGPSATSSTSAGPGSEVSTIGACRATSSGVSAHVAPASRCGAVFASSMSLTTSSCPAFCRFVAMGPPMFPRPMNPMRMVPSPFWLPPQSRPRSPEGQRACSYAASVGDSRENRIWAMSISADIDHRTAIYHSAYAMLGAGFRQIDALG